MNCSNISLIFKAILSKNVTELKLEIQKTITSITKELSNHIDQEYKKNQYKFHSKEFQLLGVRTNTVRQIISSVYKEIKNEDEKEVYELIESLLEMKFNEYIIIGFGIAHKYTKDLQESHFEIFESWIKNYIVDWGQCDDLSCGIVGKLLQKYPHLIDRSINWSKSPNVWLRRASAVSLIYSLRLGENLNQAITVANILLLDREDMVQKGYGWMLKEASKKFQLEVFNYVMDHKKNMPRTALRYAIEKLPSDLKRKAMVKF